MGPAAEPDGDAPGIELFVAHSPDETRVGACVSAASGAPNGADGVETTPASRGLSPNDVVRLGDTLMVARSVPSSTDPPAAAHDPLRPSPAEVLRGASRAIVALRVEMANAARSGLRVLIEGETGTGKDLVARVMHALSERPGVFLRVHCATFEAKDEVLLRSEGTVYLDNVRALSPAAQQILLTELERRDSGARRQCCLVAGSLCDGSGSGGDLRPDLAARLRQWTLRLAPLRDRREDILLLARHYLALERPELRLTPDAAEALLRYAWPYNVRELIHLCHRLGLDCAEDVVPVAALPGEIRRAVGSPQRARASGVARPAEAELRAALTACGGNVARVSAELGRDRKQVYRWMTLYGLTADEFRRR